jgi:nucleoside-diphosphate-sugar epimerase
VLDPVLTDPRPGDVQHSLADVSKAKRLLGYEAKVSVAEGLDQTVRWFAAQDAKTRGGAR